VPSNPRHPARADPLQDIRCGQCGALLLRAGAEAARGPLQIKCRRCGTINHLRAAGPATERPGASSEKDEAHGEETPAAPARRPGPA